MKINQCDTTFKGRKNYMVILTDADLSTDEFDKIQHLFMTKTLSILEIERSHLNIIKAIYEIPHS